MTKKKFRGVKNYETCPKSQPLGIEGVDHEELRKKERMKRVSEDKSE